MLSRTALFCTRHRRAVFASWMLVLVAGFAAAPGLFDRLTSEMAQVSNSESTDARRAINEAAPRGDEIYAVADGRAASDPGFRESVQKVAADIENLTGVAEVTAPAVAKDGRAVAISVRFDPDRPDGTMDPVVERLRTIDAPRVLVGGGLLLDEEMEQQAASDLAKAEMLSMPIVLLLLVVFMGGLVAAGIPVLMTIIGVGATLGMLTLASRLMDVSVYAVNIVTMLGLGLAVDYALLVVSRFREERSSTPDVPAAIARAAAKAGRTVVFSGLTVAASLAGLLVFPDPFLRSAGLAGILVVLLALAATITLLPAMLAMFGHRIRAARPVPDDRGLLVRITHMVSRRPLTVIAAIVPVLILAAVPFLQVRFAEPDHQSLTAESPSRQLAELVESRFGREAEVEPIVIVARGNITDPVLAPYVDGLRGLEGVTGVSVRRDAPGMTVLLVVPEGDAQGERALALVETIRGMSAPVPIQVTGDAAQLVDYQDALVDRAPLALGIVVLATFVLLFLFTGSVVVPVKALVMNTLSLGASFGALVWVFQEGHLGGLVGTEALGTLSVTTPVLMFAIAFGLSMDYEVFLLGRIAEAWRRTGDTTVAVARGLQRTGRIVTAAALLMAVVFAGFVAGGFSPVKQVGLGLMLAVLVDATLIRMLLMPAVMSLMGRFNWWAPRFLRRVRLSEETEQAAQLV